MTQLFIVSYVSLLVLGLLLVFFYSRQGEKLIFCKLLDFKKPHFPLAVRIYAWIMLGWIVILCVYFLWRLWEFL